METDGQMGLVQGIQEMRGWLAPGGHVVWSAFYGGALALTIEPDGGRIGSRVWKDPLVLMSWCTAVLFHTVWNLTAGDMAGGLLEELVYFWERLELSRVKYILLILSAWGYLLFILRRCVWQIFAYCAVYNGGRRERGEKCRRIGNQVFIYALGKGQMVREYQLPRGGSLAFGRDPGAAGVMFPVSTRGISRIHCEISFRGETPVLKDCASTYGTFFSNRRRLRPGKAYPLKDGMVFYLAERENSFKVRILE